MATMGSTTGSRSNMQTPDDDQEITQELPALPLPWLDQPIKHVKDWHLYEDAGENVFVKGEAPMACWMQKLFDGTLRPGPMCKLPANHQGPCEELQASVVEKLINGCTCTPFNPNPHIERVQGPELGPQEGLTLTAKYSGLAPEPPAGILPPHLWAPESFWSTIDPNNLEHPKHDFEIIRKAVDQLEIHSDQGTFTYTREEPPDPLLVNLGMTAKWMARENGKRAKKVIEQNARGTFNDAFNTPAADKEGRFVMRMTVVVWVLWLVLIAWLVFCVRCK